MHCPRPTCVYHHQCQRCNFLCTGWKSRHETNHELSHADHRHEKEFMERSQRLSNRDRRLCALEIALRIAHCCMLSLSFQVQPLIFKLPIRPRISTSRHLLFRIYHRIDYSSYFDLSSQSGILFGALSPTTSPALPKGRMKLQAQKRVTMTERQTRRGQHKRYLQSQDHPVPAVYIYTALAMWRPRLWIPSSRSFGLQ